MRGVQKRIFDIPNQLDKGKKQSIFLFKIKLSWLLQISRAFIFQLQTEGHSVGCRLLTRCCQLGWRSPGPALAGPWNRNSLGNCQPSQVCLGRARLLPGLHQARNNWQHGEGFKTPQTKLFKGSTPGSFPHTPWL